MQTENDFLHEIAEIILSIFKDPAIGLTKETVCRDGHFSPKMLTVDKLLHMHFLGGFSRPQLHEELAKSHI